MPWNTISTAFRMPWSQPAATEAQTVGEPSTSLSPYQQDRLECFQDLISKWERISKDLPPVVEMEAILKCIDQHDQEFPDGSPQSRNMLRLAGRYCELLGGGALRFRMKANACALKAKRDREVSLAEPRYTKYRVTLQRMEKFALHAGVQVGAMPRVILSCPDRVVPERGWNDETEKLSDSELAILFDAAFDYIPAHTPLEASNYCINLNVARSIHWEWYEAKQGHALRAAFAMPGVIVELTQASLSGPPEGPSYFEIWNFAEGSRKQLATLTASFQTRLEARTDQAESIPLPDGLLALAQTTCIAYRDLQMASVRGSFRKAAEEDASLEFREENLRSCLQDVNTVREHAVFTDADAGTAYNTLVSYLAELDRERPEARS